MKAEDVVKEHTTPLGSPAFPRGPYRFTNREYLNITYRTDHDALRKVVPEPLEIDEPLVRFEVMKMPDVTGLGSYTECGQAIFTDSDTLVGTLDYGTLRVATATMGYKHKPLDLEQAKAEICVPISAGAGRRARGQRLPEEARQPRARSQMRGLPS